MMPISIHIARTLLKLPIEKGRWRVEHFINRWAEKNPLQTITTVAGDITMSLDTSDFLQRALFASGDFDPHIRQIIQRRLKPGDVFVDIGANVGFYALYASKIAGKTGKVFAFEPSPDTFSALQKNMSLNGTTNITAAPIALSNATGQTKLFVDMAHNSGATSMRASPAAAREIVVAMDTYDNYAIEHALPVPALVKIDVEGAECLVLKGMQNLLSQLDRPAMILEISEFSLTQLGSSKEELFAIMKNNGYRAKLLSVPQLSIYSGSSLYFQYDVLFEPDSSAL